MATLNDPPVYQLIEPVGHGGFADVYRGRQSWNGATVAVKILRDTWDSSARARFENEARRQQKASGPLVVPVLDTNFTADSPFIVTEYMDKGSLGSRMEIEPAGTWRHCCALRVVLETAEAIASIHAQNLVHLDIKPDNLLFNKNDRIVLTDFGCAATMTAEMASAGCGTNLYASPEHWTSAGPKADVYPLGVMLYELFVGEALPELWWQRDVWWPSQQTDCAFGREVDLLVQQLAHPHANIRPSADGAASLLRNIWCRMLKKAALAFTVDERTRARTMLR